MARPGPKTSGRLVLAIQFWSGDRDAAMRNARRIADNEPKFRNDVEFLFVARFDCPHDPATIAHVSKKFRTSTYTSTRSGTGWPSGCNDVWCDLMCNHAIRNVYSGAWQDVKAVLTFEGDAIPVVKDWINQLSAEWNVAAAQGKTIVGCFMPPPLCGPVGHINGNAMFAPDLFARIPQIIGCSPHGGWDFIFAPLFKPHWFKTPLITNYYKSLNITEKEIRRRAPDGRIPAVVHGVKDRSVETFADAFLAGSGEIIFPDDTSSVLAAAVVEVPAVPRQKSRDIPVEVPSLLEVESIL